MAAETKYNREIISLAIQKLNESLTSIDENREWFDGDEPDFTLELIVAGLTGISLMAISALIVYCLCNKCTGKCYRKYQPVKEETEMSDLRRTSRTSTSIPEEQTINDEETKHNESPRKRKVRVIDEPDEDIPQDAVTEQPIIRSPSKSRKQNENTQFRFSKLYGSKLR
jgi:hypothetical protein